MLYFVGICQAAHPIENDEVCDVLIDVSETCLVWGLTQNQQFQSIFVARCSQGNSLIRMTTDVPTQCFVYFHRMQHRAGRGRDWSV